MAPSKPVATGKATQPKKFTFTRDTSEHKDIPQFAKSRRGMHPLRKLLIAAGVIAAVVVVICILLSMIANWFDHNRIVTHPIVEVKFNAPFSIEKRGMISPVAESTVSAIIAPTSVVMAAEEVVVEQAEESEVTTMVKAIRFLESNNGKAPEGLAVYCAKNGLSNEYGFGGMRLMHCFKDHEAATARVERWINEHMPKFDNDVDRTLCYYNLGLDQSSCTYSENYHKIKGNL